MTASSEDSGPHEKLSKLDAARRQLHTAIRLFLSNEDVVSAHTLACASHAILRTLLRPTGGGSILKDNPYVPAEYNAQVAQALNRPANFLKHADRDPDDVLTFYPFLCAMWVFDCCIMYRALTGKLSRSCVAFCMWFSLERPDLLNQESEALITTMLRSDAVSKAATTREFCLDFIRRSSTFRMPSNAIFEEDS